MGSLLADQGKLAEAEPLLREALAGERRVLGDEHLYTLATLLSFSRLLLNQQRYEEAESPLHPMALGSRRVTVLDPP